MERREKETRGQIEDDDRKQALWHPGATSTDTRSVDDGRTAEGVEGRAPAAQGLAEEWGMRSWVNWQSALYIFVLGAACVFLVPLTNLWWIVPVLGAAVPIALSMLDRPDLKLKGADAGKAKENELLHALAERGELTPAAAAMRTSLTVDEASKMLEELARKGHLKPRVGDSLISYALRERDRLGTQNGVSAPLGAGSEGGMHPRLGATQNLEDPLSERELEVLKLLASGRTNSEIARDLFISVGTVKSHAGNIYRKLDAKNRAEALTRARDLELLP
jgi:DNA-binding NarL/FixJ family response regulator